MHAYDPQWKIRSESDTDKVWEHTDGTVHYEFTTRPDRVFIAPPKPRRHWPAALIGAGLGFVAAVTIHLVV